MTPACSWFEFSFPSLLPRTGANVVGPDIIVEGEGPGLHCHPHDHEKIIHALRLQVNNTSKGSKAWISRAADGGPAIAGDVVGIEVPTVQVVSSTAVEVGTGVGIDGRSTAARAIDKVVKGRDLCTTCQCRKAIARDVVDIHVVVIIRSQAKPSMNPNVVTIGCHTNSSPRRRFAGGRQRGPCDGCGILVRDINLVEIVERRPARKKV
mmetsp:Transcript_84954/g.134518  ORF Transcript_84954/g.134518 Transcript_84954/m.134518 type:complete len:208 (+) Transcript_84954:957-1580(+)